MRLSRILKRIPKVKCPEGCTDCCSSVLILPHEAVNLGLSPNTTFTPFTKPDYKCKFCDIGVGCTVYSKRPAICRLFGTCVDGPLSCEKVICSDENLLKFEEYAELLSELSILMVNKGVDEKNPVYSFAEKEHLRIESAKGNLNARKDDTLFKNNLTGEIISLKTIALNRYMEEYGIKHRNRIRL